MVEDNDVVMRNSEPKFQKLSRIFHLVEIPKTGEVMLRLLDVIPKPRALKVKGQLVA